MTSQAYEALMRASAAIAPFGERPDGQDLDTRDWDLLAEASGLVQDLAKEYTLSEEEKNHIAYRNYLSSQEQLIKELSAYFSSLSSLSIRDNIAIAALAGIDSSDVTYKAQKAYRIADEMLLVRSKSKAANL